MERLNVYELDEIRLRLADEWLFKNRRYLMLCGGTGCHATGSIPIKNALLEEIKKKGLDDSIAVVETGCNGFCAQGPILVVQPEGIFYQKISTEDVPEFVETQLVKNQVVSRLLYKDPVSKKEIALIGEIPFFRNQMPWALRNKGLIDPESIDSYIARGGYLAAKKALLEMQPEEIIEEVKRSGLRGRGGAGFPTGIKWEFASKAAGEPKYVLCNADEGDPGAFMDRSILEADPHSVIEGMIIAARAIGAVKGYIYARTEYPLAIRRLEKAMQQAGRYGLLGEDILGTGIEFRLEIYQGAGAFVCGEETALMRSIEGKRGMPRPRPPFPAHKGLWERPTVLNNVETLANIPLIIAKGGSWYSRVGTETSKGTKVFALSGDVNNIGLVEVPMGTSLRTLVYEIGGGIPKKRNLKAVQIGGPSGGCIPESLIDTPVDYEAIAKVGAIMGSGGVIVMDDHTCMVDMARFFMEFIQDESCGKCTPCREGTRRLLEILKRISQGEGKDGDIERLVSLSESIKDSALCGLGQTAPNPVLSTLRYFRDEYEAHIKEKRCPAKRCASLLKFEVDPDICTACGACYRACPAEAISWKKKEKARIDKDKCIRCMTCFEKCRFGAIF